MKTTKRVDSHNAFTLIEIMTVLALISILAAAVAVSPTKWFTSTQLQDALDRLVFADHLLRAGAARQDGRRALAIDLENNTVAIVDDDESDRRSHRFSMPRGFKIDRVVTATRRVSSGVATIRCSVHGHTPSYAVRVSELGGERENQWLFVAGLTGQRVIVDRENELESLFKLLAP